METRILFFGILGDVTGETEIRLCAEVKSIGELRAHLEEKYPDMNRYNYRIARNGKISDTEEDLVRSGDEIAFLPPFAGG